MTPNAKVIDALRTMQAVHYRLDQAMRERARAMALVAKLQAELRAAAAEWAVAAQEPEADGDSEAGQDQDDNDAACDALRDWTRPERHTGGLLG